ncbi:MAG: hypothetical protein ACR2O4_01580, partial [Hyphomicrobiaceae bacterium]
IELGILERFDIGKGVQPVHHTPESDRPDESHPGQTTRISYSKHRMYLLDESAAGRNARNRGGKDAWKKCRSPR